MQNKWTEKLLESVSQINLTEENEKKHLADIKKTYPKLAKYFSSDKEWKYYEGDDIWAYEGRTLGGAFSVWFELSDKGIEVYPIDFDSNPYAEIKFKNNEEDKAIKHASQYIDTSPPIKKPTQSSDTKSAIKELKATHPKLVKYFNSDKDWVYYKIDKLWAYEGSMKGAYSVHIEITDNGIEVAPMDWDNNYFNEKKFKNNEEDKAIKHASKYI